MTIIRRRLRLWVTAWLVFQVASLSALVPRDCCAAHRPPASGKDAELPRKHRGHALPDARAASGTPCPMHGGNHSDAGDQIRAQVLDARDVRRPDGGADRTPVEPRCAERFVRDAAGSPRHRHRAPHTRESDQPSRVSRSSTPARVNAHRSGSKAHVCLEPSGVVSRAEVFCEVCESSGSRELRARVAPIPFPLSNRSTTPASADA